MSDSPQHPLVSELLGRIDAAAETMPSDTARRVFLGGQLEKATARYATMQRCAEKGIPDPNVPAGMAEPSAVDHLTVINEITKRIDALMPQEAA